MNVQRIGPIDNNLNQNHYNLRPRPLVINNIPQNINENAVQIEMANNAIIPGNDLGRLTPAKFSGHGQENGSFWLRTFDAYCNRINIKNEARIDAFVLLISGPCQNWFTLLADNMKDTYAHLRASFLARYVNINNNVVDDDIFHTRSQQHDEPVASYIEDMITLGNKLQLDINTIIARIKRGVLHPIRMHLMTHNVPDIQTLMQQASLIENYVIKPTDTITTPRVHFNTIPTTKTDATANYEIAELKNTNSELKQMVTGLIRSLEKAQINATQTPIIKPRSRSPTPFRDNYDNNHSDQNNSNNANEQHQTRNDNNTPFCTYCSTYGHTFNSCKLRQQTFTPRGNVSFRTQPAYQSNYQPRSQDFCNRNSFTGTQQNYAQPWMNTRPQFYAQRTFTQRPYYNNQQNLN